MIISKQDGTDGGIIMKTHKIISWILLLVVLDQTTKIIINSFFLEIQFEIIPSLFEFKPIFNNKYSYVNHLIYNNFNINMGWWFHMILFLFTGIIVFILCGYFRNYISENKKLLDVAFIFFIAGIICAFIGNLIWEKGTLDFIYLKPLFVFDLKDLYLNCFAALFLVYAHKNKEQIKTIKIKNVIDYIKIQLKITQK